MPRPTKKEQTIYRSHSARRKRKCKRTDCGCANVPSAVATTCASLELDSIAHVPFGLLSVVTARSRSCAKQKKQQGLYGTADIQRQQTTCLVRKTFMRHSPTVVAKTRSLPLKNRAVKIRARCFLPGWMRTPCARRASRLSSVMRRML